MAFFFVLFQFRSAVGAAGSVVCDLAFAIRALAGFGCGFGRCGGFFILGAQLVDELDEHENAQSEDEEVVVPEPEEPVLEHCRLIIKVNKAIDWYDKYFYAWADGVTLPGWPGVKMDFQGEETNYYVYYTMIPKSLDGKTLNYIINNNSGAQTKDLSIAISGETTATVEAADKK